MPRYVALFVGLVSLAFAPTFLLTGCGMSEGSIHTAPLPSALVTHGFLYHGGWPTFTLFVKVGTHAADAEVYIFISTSD